MNFIEINMSSIYQELMIMSLWVMSQHGIIFHPCRFRSTHHYFIPLLGSQGLVRRKTVPKLSGEGTGSSDFGELPRKVSLSPGKMDDSKRKSNDPPSKHEFSAANCLLVSGSKQCTSCTFECWVRAQKERAAWKVCNRSICTYAYTVLICMYIHIYIYIYTLHTYMYTCIVRLPYQMPCFNFRIFNHWWISCKVLWEKAKNRYPPWN